MAGLKSIHLGNIRRNKGQLKFQICLLLLILLFLFIVGYHIKKSTSPDVNWEQIAIIVAMMTLIIASLIQHGASLDQFSDCYIRETITQLEEQLKNIGESINLFYLPLSCLLTIPDQPENAQARAQKIAEINCNKHLVESSVRDIFESYMQGNEEPTLAELVKRDIEDLQKQYREVKKILEE